MTDRIIFNPAQVLTDVNLGDMQRFYMIALGYLAQAALGTATVVDGLALNPTSPPSMTVTIGQGSIFALSTIDATAFGSLPIDNNPLVKIGINYEAATPFTLTAPTTSGQSINYLIEASFEEADGTSVVLPYYNPANPSQPYSGPGGDNASQNTMRTQIVDLQLKAGAAANTGTQTTPSVDSGWVGLYVITVNYGQTSIVSGDFSIYPGAPFLGAGSLKPGRLINIQVLLSSGTYFPTVGMGSCVAYCLGGGGGSGGLPTSGAGQYCMSAGAASGAMAIGRFTAAQIGNSQAVTVGAAGVGGAAGSNSGMAGGNSSFGSLMSAQGGAPSTSQGPTSQAVFIAIPPGVQTPAVASGGNILNLNGTAGNFSIGGAAISGSSSTGALGGSGGPSPLGGSNYGAGAQGAAQVNTTATVGNTGGAGVIIVYEYS